MSFGFLSFLTFLCFLISGAVTLGASVAAQNQIASYCQKGSMNQFSAFFSRYFAQALSSIDSQQAIAQSYMCTELCPCDPSLQKTYEGLVSTKSPANFNGSISTFQDCYASLVASQTIKAWDPSHIRLVSYLEEKNRCAGLCGPGTYWLY
jgi:hypothetical protein